MLNDVKVWYKFSKNIKQRSDCLWKIFWTKNRFLVFFPTLTIFTDTDSLWYAIETTDVYKDMEMSQHLFNTSD